ncbi:hypothetical protein CHGG_06899 [Chaetomium globosum CBS 148.51]|uniref:non-specific serine/threonine protein kinase n=1 Tax=Chaetomium globosum (strain ATCC 6205 / CBS 148.51 / DSM 1962 / NBRC 6347 / NRRL 1970) TaxID=306901 RepID=Q2GYQ5_CHAGB|nr:uncharacterized protein CHGG_06899 [Chaetomium globosum CBS 148.51]EAQ85646.1 hypothetical protein CHGG_06899 [Chaetomium globosum CBS 148.51]
MSSHPEFRYTHHGLVFYPLEVPEIQERLHLANDNGNESAQYLQARRQGFVLVHWIQPPESALPTSGSVGVFASIDCPQELVIIKKLSQIIRRGQLQNRYQPVPSEIEQSSLSPRDAAVQRQLPLYHENMGLTPFPQLHAFQIHKRTPGSQPVKPEEDITLFYKYYNGGTLKSFIRKYARAGKRVPEGFIWHVIAQLCRAVSWLHTGHIPSRDENLGREDPSHPPQPPPDTWEPICHQDMHADNVLLHFPTDEEKLADPRLEQFDEYLPQIIIADFGLSFQGKNDRSDELGLDENPDLPQPTTWKDKADIGEAALRLMVPDYGPGEGEIHVLDPDDGSLNPYYCHTHPSALMGGYSEELVSYWGQFDTLILPLLHLDPYTWQKAMFMSDERDWRGWPPNEVLFGPTLALADRRVEDYIHSNNKESLLWTQTFNASMPYRSVPRNPAHHRRDWATVDGHLSETVAKTFSQFSPGCVRIRQVHIMGKGRVEQELDEVIPESAQRVDEDEDEDGRHAEAPPIQACRATVPHPRRRRQGRQPARRLRPEPPRVRDASPPIAEEYLNREWAMMVDYERGCREKGIW